MTAKERSNSQDRGIEESSPTIQEYDMSPNLPKKTFEQLPNGSGGEDTDDDDSLQSLGTKV